MSVFLIWVSQLCSIFIMILLQLSWICLTNVHRCIQFSRYLSFARSLPYLWQTFKARICLNSPTAITIAREVLCVLSHLSRSLSPRLPGDTPRKNWLAIQWIPLQFKLTPTSFDPLLLEYNLSSVVTQPI